jgi:O-succinylbenzoate synthase
MKMQIHSIELKRIHIPLLHPFTISGGTLREKQSLLVVLTDMSGAKGYGEVPVSEEPIYLTETLAGAHAVLKDILLPALLSTEIDCDEADALTEIAACMNRFDIYRGFQFAKSGVAQALCHLAAEHLGISLQKLFGGERKAIAVGESFGIQKTVEAVVQEADERVREGYKRIKLKIKPGFDRAVVDAVRMKHPKIPLMVDANSSYTLDDVPLFQELDRYSLLMIEQPLAFDDIIDHATLQKAIRTPVCLDESILEPRHARQAVETGACKIINIKPGRVGGPLRAKQIHDWCHARNVPVWCGGMFESGIGRAFNIALASLPGFTLPADMSPSSILLQYDLVKDPYAVHGGMIVVPTTPGLGFTVDEKAIERSTVSSVHISK